MISAREYRRLPRATPSTGRVGPHALTERQAAVLVLLGEFFGRHQRYPCLREIAGHLGLSGSPNGPRSILRGLERKGLVRLGGGGANVSAITIAGLSEKIAPVVRSHVESLVGKE